MIVKIMLASVFAVVALAVIGYFAGRPEYPGGLAEIDARTYCETAIKGLSVNPQSVEIAYVSGIRDGETIRYQWDNTQLQMQNRMGAMLGATADCTVNLRTAHVVNLRVI